MRLSFAVSILGIAIVLMTGCERAPAPPKPVAKSPLAVRFDATKSIMDATEREKAFVALALDGAEAGDAQLVDESLKGLLDNSLREQTKVKSVLKLGKAGKNEEALALAKTLMDNSVRDSVVSKLAKGDYSE